MFAFGLALLTGCELVAPVVAPAAPRCLDLTQELCNEAWRLAVPRLPAGEGPTQGAVISRAGGAAEGVPSPCLEMIGVVVVYASGSQVSVEFEVGPDDRLRPIGDPVFVETAPLPRADPDALDPNDHPATR
jgi:hypothetical protein